MGNNYGNGNGYGDRGNGGGGPGSKYTGTATITVGGVTAGDAFVDQDLQQMMDALISPYVPPAFTAFTVNNPVQLEVGETSPATRNFTWTATQTGNIQPNTIDLRQDGVDIPLYTGLPYSPTSANAVPVTPITRTTEGTQNFSIRAVNTQAGVFTRTNTQNWNFRIFYDAVAAAPTNSAQVRAMAQAVRYTNSGNVWNLNTGAVQQIFSFAIPSGRTLVSVIDLDALNANLTASYIETNVVVTLPNGGTENYKVYTLTLGAPYASSHRHQITIS